ncbi:MAG TPA: DegT/DnrJ/EryC1/StrS family aminotransferase [Thermoanaerobaculia bacterium]|jgi:dTDP-4-amino-4,6-dideoxygalactose transaminase|nr:DegT/DnrJ/EryC1/StrS family aminotransferase [Thermoanaerobaculia bacterium]
MDERRPRMIPFVELKRPDYGHVRELLAASEGSGTWSNFGPLSRRLEQRAAELLALPPGRTVVACANGTVALHGLVHLHEHLVGRPLRWVVSAFTFHAQRQGPLGTAIVVDCDARGYLDLDALAALDPRSYDGIVVTHLFGTPRPVAAYEEVASRHGKHLLFDSATCFATGCEGAPVGGAGTAELYSFHHTKPCGFGEGGCVVVPAALEDTFRSLINFGLCKGIDTGARSGNGKMSDVAAAFILDRWRGLESIAEAQRAQWRRLAAIARDLGLEVLVDGGGEGSLPNLVPIVFPRSVTLERFAHAPLVAHKYYRPLASRPRADDLHARVVCLPCHAGVATLSNDALHATLAAALD